MPPLEFAFLQASSASTKRKHKALSPNASSNGGDASRVGEKIQLLFSRGRTFSFHYTDAGRVAPISACVLWLRLVVAFSACV